MSGIIERLDAALAGRYRVERELGRGGMGTVYLAQDLKHSRRVAIKVLLPELGAAIGNERFQREIELSAGLNHPHIMPLHESGSADGLLYFVMPYAEGESLRQRLEREKQLPLADALRITSEVAGALDFAHRRNIVHRDIKPENILLEQQHAVLADFGIARAIQAAGGEKLTATGVTIGTPAYMSPEQAAGSQDLDGRSDVYALGCVVYEMLAGNPPFTGPTPWAIQARHAFDPVPPVRTVRPAVPDAIERAVTKALAKAPADRHATAAEFAVAIATSESPERPSRWRRAAVAWLAALALAALVIWSQWDSIRKLFGGDGAAPATRKEWVIVADFEGPADDTSLAGAVRQLVCAALDQSAIVAAVPDEQIRLALAQAGKPPGTRVDAALARELAYRRAVRAVVEGHVSRLGGSYSVVARVLDADSVRVLASVSEVARSEEELIATVGRAARRLRDALGERREDLRATRELHEIMTPSFEAYRRWVKGRELLLGGDNRGCIAMARSALSLDPDFAPAWGIMGYSFTNLGEPDSALAAWGEALRRPGRLPEVARFQAQAAVAGLRGDLQGTLDALDQALHYDPWRQATHSNRAYCLLSLGRPEEALVSSRRAAEVSLFGPTQTTLLNQFVTLLWLGRLDEAREVAQQMKGGFAENAPAQIAVAAGDWAAAESLGKALERHPGAAVSDRVGISCLAVALAARGSVSAANQSLQREQRAAAEERRRVDLEHAKRGRLLLELVSGRLNGVPEDVASSDTTTLVLVTQGLWEAAAGDTARARRLLARIRTRSVIEQNRQGSNPLLIEAWLAARAGRFGETVRLLGPAALQGDDIGSVVSSSNRVLKRWLVAEAYEGLSRPDSAAVYFELAMSPIGAPGALRDARIAYSYAHRRLVLLDARMGRLEEARRHWDLFSATFTRPDPELLTPIAQARAALASAEAMARSARP